MNAQLDALAPVIAALLARARTEAEQELADARREADSTLAEARTEARRILSEAAAAGRAAAAESIVIEHERARREARALELAVQREIYDDFAHRVAGAVSRAFTDPLMRARLVASVRAELGPDASVRDGDGGGVLGVAPGRRLDLGVQAVTERAVEALGDEVRELWAP
ncbi:hypothetical protein ACFOWZ_04605 [Lentzea rhizosphaerae]|uniref:V/A-type H+-transporting ATPase subunit E n=1 Tax=Lentzea rhizosphaerae TaxID=2041025 RepID=A0ABV8BK83_9PSEU